MRECCTKDKYTKASPQKKKDKIKNTYEGLTIQ